MSRRWVVLALLLLLGLSGTGAPQTLPAASAGAAAGKLTIVQGPEPLSMDPTMDINKTSYNIQLGLYDPLIFATPDGRLRPWIATSWTNVNPTTWRIKIRKGVTFHNGEPLNAESVAFSIEQYNRSRGEGNKYFQFIKGTKAVDAETLEITTDGPIPATPTMLGFLFVLPKNYYTQVGPERFGVEPVGSGPVKMQGWQRGVRLVVVRNEKYWRGVLPIEEITYRPAPEASTRVAMLLTGEADIIANIPPEQIPRIEAGRMRVIRQPSLRKLFVEFNMKQRPLDDVRVRRALNHAIDKEELINLVLGGNAIREIGPVPDGWLGANPKNQLTAYDYNPARARQLLAEAGVGGGFQMDLWHSIGRYLKDKEIAEAIAAQLGNVGVRVNLQGMDIGSLVQRIHTQNLSGAHLFSWAPLIFDTDNLWRAHFYSKGLNQYAVSAKTDELLLAGAAALDRRERQRIYSELERHVVNDMVPWIFLYRQSLIYGVSNKVGWLPRADEVINVRNLIVK
ncbi:MAG: hypothetical protein FJX78_08150 [Armatimonadetes bacterium]|nr:hypothetical protein [Armatimonadota bacterium]